MADIRFESYTLQPLITTGSSADFLFIDANAQTGIFLQPDSVAIVQATVIAFTDTAGGTPLTATAAFRQQAVFSRLGSGTPAIQLPVSPMLTDTVSDSLRGAGLGLSTGGTNDTIVLVVQGIAATTITWQGFVQATIMTAF